MAVDFEQIASPSSQIKAFWNPQPCLFDEIKMEWQDQINKMYKTAYANSNWHPTSGHFLVFQESNNVAGVVTMTPIEQCELEDYFSPLQKQDNQRIYQFNNYIVSSQLRGQRLGIKLMESSIKLAFERHHADLVVAYSRHANTHYLWRGLGGQVYQPDIALVNCYLDEKTNLQYFQEFTNNPFWKQWKFPEGIRMFMNREDFTPSTK